MPRHENAAQTGSPAFIVARACCNESTDAWEELGLDEGARS
jgi:hypothetical protein